MARLALFFVVTGKKFSITKRGARLLITAVSLQVALSIPALFLPDRWAPVYLAALSLYCLASAGVSLALLAPLERHITTGYIKKSKEILAQMPIRIGVTGSAGKTSVKNILSAVLSTRYTVLATPHNYNTPMGIAKSLSAYSGQDVFIAEMGARRVGDIAELVDMVEPHIGVLTTVNEQHLETFRSIDNIIREKTRLIDGASQCGVVNVTCPYLKDREYAGDVVAVGKDVYATDVRATLDGTSFVAHLYGQSIEIETALLGAKCVDNVLLAMAVAAKLDVPLDAIRDSIRELRPTPHRLEKSETARGIIILDDGYNSNVDGVDMAIDLMRTHSGRVIVCAQGIVEQGGKTATVNCNIGGKLAAVADVIIAVGVNRKHIAKGALAAGLSPDQLYELKTLKEATKLFGDILKRGDLLYLQNDVPVIY